MMRFQVSTNRTGIHRVVKVVLFDTLVELRAEYFKRWPDEDRSYPPLACMIPWCREGAEFSWVDRDPRPHLATLWFAADTVTVTELAHEATHAAAHLYSVDCYRDNARATAHLSSNNEILAYLVGDLVSRVGNGLMQRLDDGLNLGRAEFYGTAEHPPHLKKTT